VVPAPAVSASAAEQVRHSRRELRLVQENLTREREQLERVRTTLASQRLVMSANEQQIITWRDGLVAERDRLEKAVATLTQQHQVLTRELPTLEARQSQLAREVATQLTDARQQSDSIHRAAQAEAKGLIDSVRAQIEQIRVASQREAERSTQSARQQADVILAAASAKSDELAMEAGRIIEQAHREADDARRSASEEHARLSADLATRTAQAAAARKASEADLARRSAELEQTHAAAQENIARQTATARAELSAAEAVLARRAADVNADITRRSEALQRQVADAEARQSAVRAEETRVAELRSKLTEQEQLLARESADLARRRRGLATSEQKIHDREISLKQKIADTEAALRQKEAAFDTQLQQKFADVEAAIARRNAESDTALAARHANAEADLARRIAETQSTAAALAELEQSLAEHSQQLNRKESDLEHSHEQLDNRRAQVDRLHADASTDRGAAAALRQQFEAQALQCEQELAQVRSKSEQLATDLEEVRRQRATAEKLTAELETKTEHIRAIERQVLGSWDEVRREHATVTKVRAELDRERGELAAALAIAKAPSIRIIERRMSWSAYGRWAAVLVIATAVSLLVSEATVFFAIGPVSEAAGRLHLVVVDESPDNKASVEAIDEWQAFLRETRAVDVQRSAQGIRSAAADWRIEVMATDSHDKSATLAVYARADSPDGARERSDGLTNGFLAWRGEKLRSAGGSGSVEELQKRVATAQLQRDTTLLAEQSARNSIDDLFKENRLDPIGTVKPEDVLCAVDARTSEFEAAVKSAQAELSKVSGDLWGWRTEAEQLRQHSSASQPDPLRLAEELRVAKIETEKNLALARSLNNRVGKLYSDRLAAAQTDLRSARTEWDAAAAALIAAITSRDTRTSDPAVATAARRFEKAQIAYTDALASVDPEQDRLLRTWAQQLAELKDGIATRQAELATTAAALDRAGRLVKLAGLIAAAQKRADQLSDTIQTDRAVRVALLGDRATYGNLAQKAQSAEASVKRVQEQLAHLREVSLARSWSAGQSAEVLWSHNDRLLDMLLTAGIVLALATGAGLLGVLILTRPREEVLDAATLAAGGADAFLRIARLASGQKDTAAKSAAPAAAGPGGGSSN
jgi:hypothetical protein